jgi:hypothetical protein
LKAQQIRALPEGTKVRGKFGEGTVTFSSRYGKGVRFSNYPYSFPEDMHGFDGCMDDTLERLVTEIVEEVNEQCRKEK